MEIKEPFGHVRMIVMKVVKCKCNFDGIVELRLFQMKMGVDILNTRNNASHYGSCSPSTVLFVPPWKEWRSQIRGHGHKHLSLLPFISHCRMMKFTCFQEHAYFQIPIINLLITIILHSFIIIIKFSVVISYFPLII